MRGARQIQDGHGIRNGKTYKRFQYDKKRLSFTINSSSEFYSRVYVSCGHNSCTVVPIYYNMISKIEIPTYIYNIDKLTNEYLNDLT